MILKVKVKLLSGVQLFATPWTVACQAPQSMEFSRQEYWSELPFPSPGDLPHRGIEPGSPAWQADSLPTDTRKAQKIEYNDTCKKKRKKNTLGQSGVYSRNPRLVQYLKVIQGTSLVVQWLRLCSNAGGLGSIPSQGTRSHVLQPRIHMPQLKISHATTNVKDPTCHN